MRLTLALFLCLFSAAQWVGHTDAQTCQQKNPGLTYQQCRILYG